MKLGARARLTLVVMLGVVVGLGFITLPAILAVPPHSLPATITTGNSTSGTTTPALFNSNSTTRFGNSTGIQTPTETTTLGTLSVLLSLIVIPALALSVLTSRLVSRRVRKVLDNVSEDKPSEKGPKDHSIEDDTLG